MNDRTTFWFNRRVPTKTRRRRKLIGGSVGRLLVGSLLGVDLAAAEVTLAWDPSPDPEVIAFRIYWGTRSRAYTQHLEVGRVTTARVTGLSTGSTYFFAATALATGGLESDFSNEVQYTVPNPPTNRPPTLSFLANRTIAEDTSTGPIFFTVGDPDNALTALTVSALSSNPALVPASGLVLGVSGTSRVLVVTPAAQQWGTATITVRVSDGALVTARSFVLTVTPVNDPPTLSVLADQTLVEGASTGPLAFTVGDVDNDPATLSVTATHDNPALIPATGLLLGGSGIQRTLTLTPTPGQSGAARVTLMVSDGLLTASRTFGLTVVPDHLPAPWQTADLGTPVPAGEARHAEGVFTLEASGRDLGGFADEGFFLYQHLTGDGVITARVRELENVLLPRAGVMIRESLGNTARMVFLHISPYSVSLTYRVTPGSYAFMAYAGPPRPAPDNWLRLVRAGNTFTAYHSPNGVDWRPVSLPVTLDLGGEVYVGLAASSGWSGTVDVPGRSTRAVFDQVHVVR